MVVLLGFTALSVDVGFYLRQRSIVQHAVDAAALAAAQELPDDQAAAEQLARDYAEANGVDADTLDINFECTSEFTLACDPSQNKWDTIRISGSLDVPFFFAPVLKLAGVEDKCWLDTCAAVNSAAACRGLCGGSPFNAVDVVMTIDHTASLTSGELDSIKEGTDALYGYFDESKQHIGLAVTPPVDPDNHCDSINTWGDPEVYLPVPITDDYQTSPGVLDYSSALVSTTNCLDRPGFGELPGAHTKLGEPIKAAQEELQANGRPGEKWGIILLTDGAANVYNPPVTTGSTGRLSPSANAAVTSGSGDNNGFQSSATAAYSNGGSAASDSNSGTGTSTSCSDSGKDRHQYYNYGISLPGGASVTGIEVRLDAYIDSTFSSTRRMCVELSWDGGASWTSAQQTSNLSTSQNSFYLGGSSDDWGHTWDADAL
ncbi:MAG TPA: pilus assembly protein TadG-related protein, partial [Dehalococcoidia bacterium]